MNISGPQSQDREWGELLKVSGKKLTDEQLKKIAGLVEKNMSRLDGLSADQKNALADYLERVSPQNFQNLRSKFPLEEVDSNLSLSDFDQEEVDSDPSLSGFALLCARIANFFQQVFQNASFFGASSKPQHSHTNSDDRIQPNSTHPLPLIKPVHDYKKETWPLPSDLKAFEKALKNTYFLKKVTSEKHLKQPFQSFDYYRLLLKACKGDSNVIKRVFNTKDGQGNNFLHHLFAQADPDKDLKPFYNFIGQIDEASFEELQTAMQAKNNKGETPVALLEYEDFFKEPKVETKVETKAWKKSTFDEWQTLIETAQKEPLNYPHLFAEKDKEGNNILHKAFALLPRDAEARKKDFDKLLLTITDQENFYKFCFAFVQENEEKQTPAQTVVELLERTPISEKTKGVELLDQNVLNQRKLQLLTIHRKHELAKLGQQQK